MILELLIHSLDHVVGCHLTAAYNHRMVQYFSLFRLSCVIHCSIFSFFITRRSNASAVLVVKILSVRHMRAL